MTRTAAHNGNGRAVLPPVTAPAVTRYRQPQPPPRSPLRLLGRLFGWLLAALAVVAAGIAGGYYLYADRTVADLVARSPDVKQAQKKLDVPLPGHAAIALVVGYDRRLGPDGDFVPRSDTVMLVRADPQTNALSMLSFPRDLRVDVRCPGRAPISARINDAYAECGSRGTLETVKALTGLPINYLITVNFRGFRQLVAKLGGVWMDVDHRYFNDNSSGGPTYPEIDLKPGYQKLNGTKALDFVRYRHADSDIYRIARQQLFVKAFNEQLRSAFSPTSVPRIVSVVRQNIEVGTPGGKELQKRTVFSYALFAFQLPQGHFFQTRLAPENLVENPDFSLSTDPANIEGAVRDFTTPDVDAAENATNAALGRKPKPARGPKPSQISVTVVNGNGISGSATNGAYHLEQRGYQIIRDPRGALPNAPTYDYARTKVYYEPRALQGQLAARGVASLFGAADVARIPAKIRRLGNGAMLVVVVGNTFDGNLARAASASVPRRQPPATVRNPEVTRSLLEGVARRVPFPLQIPTVLENTSIAAADAPVRVYEIAGRRTVRLTFGTGTGEFWGVQMIAWNDAPILAGPNEKLRIGGRRFELHYTGTKLRMVVLRAGGATYWVVNTLLNTLSNETMLAIAKGLRPLK